MDEEIGIEPKTTKKPKTSDGNDAIVQYMEAKRQDEANLQKLQLSLNERRLQLDEKKVEDDRIERDRYWENAEAERKFKMEKLKLESEEKMKLYELIRDLKK